MDIIIPITFFSTDTILCRSRASNFLVGNDILPDNTSEAQKHY